MTRYEKEYDEGILRIICELDFDDQLAVDMQMLHTFGVDCAAIFELALRNKVNEYKDHVLRELKQNGACRWTTKNRNQ